MVFSIFLKLFNNISNLFHFQGLNYYMKYLLDVKVPTILLFHETHITLTLLFHEIHITLMQENKSFLKSNYLHHLAWIN